LGLVDRRVAVREMRAKEHHLALRCDRRGVQHDAVLKQRGARPQFVHSEVPQWIAAEDRFGGALVVRPGAT
jgi:hypothetical protein